MKIAARIAKIKNRTNEKDNDTDFIISRLVFPKNNLL
jgi:hypothetical protein